jgi:hypothetical protein
MKSAASQRPTPNSQSPNELALGVGSWELEVDAPLSYSKSASAIRRVAATAALILIGGASNLLACPVCFGAEETSMIDGSRLGVVVMLAILFAVQGGFVAFFLYLRRRAKRIADLDLDTEWSDLQGTPRTS